MTWYRAYGRTLLHARRDCPTLDRTTVVTRYEPGALVTRKVLRTCSRCGLELRVTGKAPEQPRALFDVGASS